MSEDKWPPPFLQSTDKLITSDLSDAQNNACIGDQLASHDGFGVYCKGYRHAARHLAEQMVNRHNPSDLPIDIAVYPLMFLYQHHIELRIKQLLMACSILEEMPQWPPDKHKIRDYWDVVRHTIEKHLPEADWSQNQHATRLIRELTEVDPAGMSGRYPFQRVNGKFHVEEGVSFRGHKLLNIRHFVNTIEKLCEYLETIVSAVEYCLENRNESD